MAGSPKYKVYDNDGGTMLSKGTRVALHPACDEWMQGDRFGVVVGYGRAREYIDTFTKVISLVRPYSVQLDSGRVRRFHPDNVSEVYDGWQPEVQGV